MEAIFTQAVYFFRESVNEPQLPNGESVTDEEMDEHLSDWEPHLVCVQCHEVITNPVNRISVDGSHTHTFANPHGIIFEIECFGAAPGCGTAGPATDDFSWFKGFQWKIAVCRRCLNHLGWQFTSGSSFFFGLISDRLIELKADDSAP